MPAREQEMGTKSAQWVEWPEKAHASALVESGKCWVSLGCLGGSLSPSIQILPAGEAVQLGARARLGTGQSPGGFAGDRAEDLESLGDVQPSVNGLAIAQAFGVDMHSEY